MKPIFFLATLTLLAPPSAFAIPDEKLAEVCLEKGREKVAAQVKAWNCEADIESLEIEGVDNRWYNPSKYIWYGVEARCPNGYNRVTKIVQYYRGRCI